MGNWAIVITGHGAHHNGKPDIDADLIAGATVNTLKKAGQVIEHAEFVTGTSVALEAVAKDLAATAPA